MDDATALFFEPSARIAGAARAVVEAPESPEEFPWLLRGGHVSSQQALLQEEEAPLGVLARTLRQMLYQAGQTTRAGKFASAGFALGQRKAPIS